MATFVRQMLAIEAGPRRGDFPAASRLTAAVFRLQLAARIRAEKLARIEPVVRRRSPQDRRKRARELADAWAAPMPQRRARGDLVEAEDLFDAAVAIRCDRKDLARQRFLVLHAHDDVVVKLTLPPMIDEIVVSKSPAQRLE